MADEHPSLAMHLKAAGFQEEIPGEIYSKDQLIDSKQGLSLRNWTLSIKGDEYVTENLEIYLHIDSLKRQIKSKLRHSIKDLKDFHFIKKDDHGFYIIIRTLKETNNRSLSETYQKDHPYPDRSLLAASIQIFCEDGFLIISYLNHLFLGPERGEWPLILHDVIAESLGLEPTSLHSGPVIQRFDITRLALASLPLSDKLFDILLKKEGERPYLSELKTIQDDFVLSYGKDIVHRVQTPLDLFAMEYCELQPELSRSETYLKEKNFRKFAEELQLIKGLSPVGLYLFAIVAPLHGVDLSSTDSSQLLLHDEENLLALSLKVAHGETPEDRLEAASDIIQVLTRKINGFEENQDLLEPITDVMTSLWFDVHPKKALKAIRQLETLCPYDIKVHLKTAVIARTIQDHDTEIKAIKKAIKSLPHHDDLNALLHLDLAKLTYKTDPETAIGYAQKALAHDHHRLEITYFLCDRLIEKGEALLAVSLIDRAIKHLDYQNRKSSSQDRVDLELKAADIWLHHLAKPELAHIRFDRVLMMAIENKAVIQPLYQTFKNLDDIKRVLKCLDYIFGVHLNSIDEKTAHLSLLEYYDLYQKGEVKKERIAEVLSLFEKKFGLPKPLIEDLVSDHDLSLPWEHIYDRLKRDFDHNSPNKQAQANLLITIAQAQLGISQKTISFILECAEDGLIPEASLTDLLPQLESEIKEKELIRFLKLSLKNSNDYLTRVFLLKKILELPLPPDEKDFYLIELTSIDQSYFREFHDQCIYYIKNDQIDGMNHLYTELLAKGLTVDLRINLLELMIKLLLDSKMTGHEILLTDLYHRLSMISPQREDILKEAVENLAFKVEPKKLTGFMQDLLIYECVPDIAFDLMEKILADDEKLARLFSLIAKKNSDESRLIAARKAVDYGRKLSHHEDLEIENLLIISPFEILEESEISRTVAICTEKNRLEDLKKIIRSQLEITTDLNKKSRLADILITYQGSYNLTPDEVLKFYSDKIKTSEDPVTEIFELARYPIDRKIEEDPYPFLRLVFDHYDTWKHFDKVEEITLWAIDHLSNLALIKSRVLEETRKLLEENDPLFLKYERLLAKLGVDDYNIISTALDWYCDRGDLDHITEAFERKVRFLKDRSSVQSVLAKMRELFEFRNISPHLYTLLKKGMDHGFPEGWADPVKEEFQLHYALESIEKNEDMDRSTNILENHFFENPEDQRTWFPLYFYYKETERTKELRNLLQYILPILKTHLNLLRDYPVTIESLKAEFIRLSDGAHSLGQTNIRTKIPEQTFQKISWLDTQTHLQPMQDVQESPVTIQTSAHKRGMRIEAISEGQFFLNQPMLIREMVYQMKDHAFPNTSEGLVIVDRGIDEAIMGQFNTIQSSTLFDRELSELVLDWRETVRSLNYTPGMTDKILNTAFPSELEKHIALQAFAIISGEIDRLSNWPLPVWRNPAQVRYPFELSNRFNRKNRHPLLSGHLIRLLNLIKPRLVARHKRRFTIDHIAAHLHWGPKQVLAARRQMSWSDPRFQVMGLSRYSDRLKLEEFSAFNLQGLGSKVFFDYRNKSIYFDSEFYEGKTKSFIFHRILAVLTAVRLGFYPFLKLNASRHILPFLGDLQKELKQKNKGPLAVNIKELLAPPKSPSLLKNIDRAHLESLLATVGYVSITRLEKLQMVLWSDIYRIQLAETLDLVGILEAITGQDLLLAPPKPREILALSAFAQPLLEMTTYLKFD